MKMERFRVLYQLEKLISPTSAKIMEHAIFASSKNYRRTSVRILTAITEGNGLEMLKTMTPQEFVVLPQYALFDNCSLRKKIQFAQDAHRQRLGRLDTLKRTNIASSLDNGVKCGRCKTTDVSFSFLQTRSADEGTTTFCECLQCGSRWKM
jgi:DNA-directed RNA polymerase subunit M/transcription elongation factor TFIIS